MNRNYWLDLFTGITWEEFKKHGATVSGFRRHRRRLAKEIHPGDYLLCYLTGIMRFVGVLEVKSECYEDDTPIWDDSVFPIRFKVDLVYELTPTTAVPVLSLRDKLSFFKNLKSPHAWTGFFRGSPAKFKTSDGQIIVQAIKETIENPLERDFDQRKYNRRPKIFESTKLGVVTVPEEETEEVKIEAPVTVLQTEKSTHEEIQWLLLKLVPFPKRNFHFCHSCESRNLRILELGSRLKAGITQPKSCPNLFETALGSDLGLDVWVARNDRNRVYNGNQFTDIPRMKSNLPRQFDDATNRTIELIDVLWLKGDAILAAFEVEHTSAIYSGLLRMADLITMQPNIKINLYLVAPEDRREKVFNEINRPTFAKLKPPLPKICKFIPYSELKAKIKSVGSMIKYTKPEFIEEIAESCEPDEA